MSEKNNGYESDSLKKPDYTASHVRETAGLSYRQLNSWKVDSSRDSENGWRRFTGSQVIALTILSVLKTKGIPVQSMRKLYKWLSVPKTVEWMLEMAYMGFACYLITDLEETFTVEGPIDAADMLQAIGGSDRAYIFLPLNKIFNRFLEAGGCPPAKIKYTLWDLERMANGAATASISDQEKTILNLIKRKDFQKILITVKDGKPVLLNIEEELNGISLQDVEKLVKDGKYQKIMLVQKHGQVLTVRKNESIKL